WKRKRQRSRNCTSGVSAKVNARTKESQEDKHRESRKTIPRHGQLILWSNGRNPRGGTSGLVRPPTTANRSRLNVCKPSCYADWSGRRDSTLRFLTRKKPGITPTWRKRRCVAMCVIFGRSCGSICRYPEGLIQSRPWIEEKTAPIAWT